MSAAISRGVEYDFRVKGFDQVDKAFDRASARVAEWDKATGRASRSATELSNSAKGLGQSAGRAADGIEDSGEAAAKAAKEYDRAEREAKSLGSRLDAAAASAQKADRALEGAGAAARDAGAGMDAAGGNLGGLNDRVKNGLQGFDELQGRLGQVTNAINLFSGIAIVGMVTGVRDGVKAIYELTDAGKAAKAATEDHAKALDATVARLTSLSDITRAATQDVVAFYRAQVESEAAQRDLKPLLEERIELEDKLIYRQRQLAAGLASGSKVAMANAISRVKAYSIEIGENEAKIRALGERYKAAADSLTGLNTTMEQGGKVFRTLTGWYDAALKSGASYAAQQADALSRLRHELAIVEGLDLDAVLTGPGPSVDDVIGPPAMESVEAIEAYLFGVKQAVDANRGLTMSYEEVGRAMMEAGNEYVAYGDEVVYTAKAVEAATEAEAAAHAASASAIITSAGSIAEATGASVQVKAAAKGAALVADGVEQAFLSAAAFAAQDYVGGVMHAAAVPLAGFAAAEQFKVAGGGGGGGAKPAAGGGGGGGRVDAARVRGDRDRERAAGPTVVNVNFSGQPLVTRRDVQMGALEAVDGGSRRAGRRRLDSRRLFGTGRR